MLTIFEILLVWLVTGIAVGLLIGQAVALGKRDVRDDDNG